jgi:hypothetical protein
MGVCAMQSDQAMWASVALVDYLRNGVPFEDAPAVHVGRTLASMINCFGRPLDEYWLARIEYLDGAYYSYTLAQAGDTGYEMVGVFAKYGDAMYNALDARTWDAYRTLPDGVWKLLKHLTGMERAEWDGLPAFCRELLAEPVVCPECEHTDCMERFGEPEPIDDPSYFHQHRVSLVFHCAKCGTEINYSIRARAAQEYHAEIFGKSRLPRRLIVGMFLALTAATLLYVMFRHPLY